MIRTPLTEVILQLLKAILAPFSDFVLLDACARRDPWKDMKRTSAIAAGPYRVSTSLPSLVTGLRPSTKQRG
jgi:hypothetical protein